MSARKRKPEEDFETYRQSLKMEALVMKLRKKGYFRKKFHDCEVQLVELEDGSQIKTKGKTYVKENDYDVT